MTEKRLTREMLDPLIEKPWHIPDIHIHEVSLVTMPEGMPPDVMAGWGVHPFETVWEQWRARPWMERAFLRIKYLNWKPT